MGRRGAAGVLLLRCCWGCCCAAGALLPRRLGAARCRWELPCGSCSAEQPAAAAVASRGRGRAGAAARGAAPGCEEVRRRAGACRLRRSEILVREFNWTEQIIGTPLQGDPFFGAPAPLRLPLDALHGQRLRWPAAGAADRPGEHLAALRAAR